MILIYDLWVSTLSPIFTLALLCELDVFILIFQSVAPDEVLQEWLQKLSSIK